MHRSKWASNEFQTIPFIFQLPFREQYCLILKSNPRCQKYNLYQLTNKIKDQMNWQNMYMNYNPYWPYFSNQTPNSMPNINFVSIPYFPPIQHPIPSTLQPPRNPPPPINQPPRVSPSEPITKTLKKDKNQRKTTKHEIKKSVKGCQCTKSRCIKQYCLCFKDGISCTQLCQCQDCRNNDDQVNRQERRKKNKIIVCSCVRNKCSKKYCECFASGRKCGRGCKCVNCQNEKQN